MNEILSDNSLKNSGIFDPNKVNSLISKTKKQLTISEIDQMAITGIVSTQILFDKFISNSIRANHDQLKNYRLINECTNKNN
jgi:asparagine synthase (glutamine-hydrolysing)